MTSACLRGQTIVCSNRVPEWARKLSIFYISRPYGILSECFYVTLVSGVKENGAFLVVPVGVVDQISLLIEVIVH